MTPDMTVIITGILVAVSCGLIGLFLILRQNAMLGDAISHSILPGLVLAFLITGSRNVLPMFIGAGVVGVLTAFITETISKTERVYKDAALGIVFTTLFAIGVILVSIFTGEIDLDQECVLYGEITYVHWDRLIMFGLDIGPRAPVILAAILIIDILFIFLFFKQLKITSFDPQFADSLMISSKKWHYILMIFVSMTVVASFESVGAILVIAMLILPGATSFLLTTKLLPMLLLSALFGTLSALGGYYCASLLDTSISSSIAVFGGIIFFIIFLIKSVVRTN
ncbi:MAG: metal ABC transporter permease [Calditrichaeota bacterium]|nr:MAG: metal ABC transporter permease [Calditrichota bacterium]